MNEELIQRYVEGKIVIENNATKNSHLIRELHYTLKKRGILRKGVPVGTAKFYRWNVKGEDWEAESHSHERFIKGREIVSIHEFYKKKAAYSDSYSIF